MVIRVFIRICVLSLVLLLVDSVAAFDTLELEIEGLKRTARVYPGKEADKKPVPLVFVFHGRGDNLQNFTRAVHLHKDWPEATVVYPRGLKREDEGNMSGWLGAPGREDLNRDLEFVDRMLIELPKRYRVDPERVYVSGFSNGGRLTFILLAQRPHAFAAFVMIGALSPDLAGASQPRPVMYLFGKNEPQQYQEMWSETAIALVNLNHGGPQQEWAPNYREFPAGEGGAQTIINLYRAGHIWPFDGNRNIIRFFKEHRIKTKSTF